MNFRRKALAASLLALLLFVPLFAGASTPEPPAVPRDYVVDLAGVVNNSVKSQLDATLLQLEQKTTAQVLVLTVLSLDGESIEEFAFNTKEQWKLGQKGKDNGVLLVVAVQDRKYRFEIGYGLEGVLPDSLVGTIGRQYLVPYFRKGDYSTGIEAATLAVVKTIAESQGVRITGVSGLRRPGVAVRGKPGIFQTILFALMLGVGIILFITHPRQCFLILLLSQMGGGRGGWSGGGGFGGGGFGGFGGGGGGSGGGGGASGGW